MHESFRNVDDDCELRGLATGGHPVAQIGVTYDGSSPLNAKSLFRPRNHEVERDLWVRQNVRERVAPAVSRTIRYCKGVFIDDDDKASCVALRRNILVAVAVRGADQDERRNTDECCKVRIDVIDRLASCPRGRMPEYSAEVGFARDNI